MPRTKKRRDLLKEAVLTPLKKENISGMGSQAWPELREAIAVITWQDGDDQAALALLSVVNEFRQCKDMLDVRDLCDSYRICVYQTTRRCEKASYEFAKEAAGGL